MEHFKETKVCAICNSAEYTVVHHFPKEFYSHDRYITHSWDGGFKTELQIVKCKNCGLVYQNPCFNEAGLQYLYPESIIAEKLDYKKLMSEHKFSYFTDTIISKFYPSPREKKYTAVDIGTRFGVLPELLAQRGFNAFGIEYNAKCVESARASGFTHIHQGTINDLQSLCASEGIGIIDLVILIDVIEHLLHPMKDFTEISKLQNSGGRILVTTMDLDSTGYKLFGQYWYYLHAQHTYYFTRESMKLMFDKLGYDVEAVYQIPKYKNLTILWGEYKKLRRHKKERESPVHSGPKKWFAADRPTLFDLFTFVLRKR